MTLTAAGGRPLDKAKIVSLTLRRLAQHGL
jgi:hypothetical protein